MGRLAVCFRKIVQSNIAMDQVGQNNGGMCYKIAKRNERQKKYVRY